MRDYPDLPSVRERVNAELARNDPSAAFAVLKPVAHAVASESGAEFRDLIDGMPLEIWHRDPHIAAAMGQSYRASDAPRGAAALAYFAAAEDAIAHTPETPPHCRAAVLIGHAAALRTRGRFIAAGEKLSAAGRVLDGRQQAATRIIVELRARWALETGIIALHEGDYNIAQHQLETAHGLAEERLSRAETIECLGALSLLDFVQARSESADDQIAAAREIAEGTRLMASGFGAPVLAAEMFIAIDRGQLAHAASLEGVLRDAGAGNEWHAYALLLSGVLRNTEGRYPEALDELANSRAEFRRWERAGIGYDFGEMMRGVALAALGRGDEGRPILDEVRTYEQHVLCPARFIAAQALAAGDLLGADAAIAECEALGDDHSARPLIDVRLLRGAIEFERGALGVSDPAVDRAFVAMARKRTRLSLRVLPPGLLSKLVTRALQRRQSPDVAELLESVRDDTEGTQHHAEPLSGRERLVLAQVERGSTVAAIAAALYISPNTVKTHLRRLYKKLGVTTRGEAIRVARTLGLGSEITRGSPGDGSSPPETR